MTRMELGSTLRALRREQARAQNELAKLDNVITALTELSGTSLVKLHADGRKRTLSAAARNSIAKAQRLRWAKWKKEHTAKG
jgi:hypothetical protein